MIQSLLTAQELTERMLKFSRSYFLVDVRRDRLSYYALDSETLKKNWILISGVCLNYIMDGELEKARELIYSLPDDDVMKTGLIIVFPGVKWSEFVHALNKLKEMNIFLTSVILTAGRPQLLNGFGDFTRLGPFLTSYKKRFMEDFKYIYEQPTVPAIYNLCLAEYYYQQNKIFDAEVLVSRTIKEFDNDSERRLLFAALYLQSKILIANGKIVNAGSYIKNIRSFVKKIGEAEFSYNIDAAEALAAMYEGNYSLISAWLKNNAPDEFSDFNMLDLYRYMVKIRCYIIKKEFSAVVALVEKLRPLLEQGRRFMDLCEIDVLLAISLFRAGKKEFAFEALERALKIAKRRNYIRLIADEGEAILHVMIEYVREKGEAPFVMRLVETARNMAILQPLYLKVEYQVDKRFSPMEVDVLRLLEQGKTKEEIAEFFFISVNTVKYHIKNIYSKLGVKTANHAVWEARLIGLL